DGVVFSLPGVTIDDVLAQADALLRGLESRGEQDAEACNLAGSAMLLAADRGHPGGDLDRGVELLAQAVGLTPVKHLDYVARVSNLAGILQDRFERYGAKNDIDLAVRKAKIAVGALPTADMRRPLVVNIYVNALVCRWQFYNDDADLVRALDFLAELAAFGPPTDVHFANLRENAALLAYQGARAFQSQQLLAISIRLFEESIGEADPTNSRVASRIGALAAALAEKYKQNRDDETLERAILAASRAVKYATDVDHEWAIHATTLGNLLHDSYLRWGRVSDLNDAAQLHTQALDRLAQRAPGTPKFLNNIAIVLNERFERFGALEDLRRAVEAIERSLALSVVASRDHASGCNNAGHMLMALYNVTGRAGHLQRARELCLQGIATARERGDRATELALLGTLSDVLQTMAEPAASSDRVDEGRVRVNPAQARGELVELWDLRRDDLLSGTGGARAARLIRAARLADLVPGIDAERALEEATQSAARQRPALALAASRELLSLRLRRRVEAGPTWAGSSDPARTATAGIAPREAAGIAFASVRALVDRNRNWRESLTWLRDARGVGAMAAQWCLLDDDPVGALAAFEQGHALLLGDRVAERSSRPPERGTDWTALGPALTIWATPFAGGLVISDDGKPLWHGVAAGLTSSRVAEMRRQIATAPTGGTGDVDAAVADVAAELSQYLIPVADLLADSPHLTICAAGSLGSLPWHAVKLPAGGLLDDATILYSAPTLSVAAGCQEARSARSVRGSEERWSLSAPTTTRYRTLAHAASEGSAFAEGERLLLGPEATVQAAMEAHARARVLHFACHAALGAPDPLANRLLLADDEAWFAGDIIAAGSGPRLVVLSACETGAVEGLHADEGLGLASAFLANGTPAVIASLWSVGDASAAAFMKTAAPALVEVGNDPAEVLRDVRAYHRGRGAPPSAWAAFTCLGR
ncbi:MAG: CHAT domain-containing protein, partial [Candidatus Nanopelagicales bacterium]